MYILTENDKEILLENGYKESDLKKLQDAIDDCGFYLYETGTSSRENEISPEEAYELLGQEVFLNSIARSVSHQKSIREVPDTDGLYRIMLVPDELFIDSPKAIREKGMNIVTVEQVLQEQEKTRMSKMEKYIVWDNLEEISMGRMESSVAEKMASEVAYHLKAAGEEVSDDLYVNISRLEDKNVMSVFDKTGHLLYADLGVEYDLLDLVHRKEQLALRMKDIRFGTDLDNMLCDAYDTYVNSMFAAASTLIRYAVMTGETIIPEDMEAALTPENVSEWLDNAPGGDLIEVAIEARYNMRSYCDMKFDNAGTLLPEKSRGDIDAMKELAEVENPDLERE